MAIVDYSKSTSGVKFKGSDDRQAYSITGSNYNDTLTGNENNDTIDGGAGNDVLNGGAGNNYLKGGSGSDIFLRRLSYTDENDNVKMNNGTDTIVDYGKGDKISVTGGSVSSAKFTSSGNAVLTVGEGKIIVKDASDKSIVYVDTTGSHTLTNKPYTLSQKGVTLTSAYTDDTLTTDGFGNFKDTVVTIDASAVEHSLTITGNKIANRIIGSEEDDIIDGAGGADKIFGNDGNDSLNGGAGNDILTGGKGADTLFGGAGSDVFVYNDGDGKDIIVDYAKGDKISIVGGVVSKTVKGSTGNIALTVGNGKITIKDVANTAIVYVDNDGEHTINGGKPIILTEKGATLTSAYTEDSVAPSAFGNFKSTVVTIDASAVEQDLTITGNAKANRIIGTNEKDIIDGAGGADKIFGNDGNDSISGGAGNDNLNGGDGSDTLLGGDDNDTLEGGKGADFLRGGDGNDVFVYNKGDGNDTIVDYAKGDKISIVGGVVSKTVKGSTGNIALTVGNGKITIKDVANTAIVYVDDEGIHTINGGKPIILTEKGATLTSAYTEDSVAPSAFGNFKSTVITIDASAVEQDLTITGNAKANRIIGTDQDDIIDGAGGADKLFGNDGNDSINGGAGNDNIDGGKGNDTLTGGAGSDVFVYNKGEGNDTIVDYEKGDKISIVGGVVSKTVKGSTGNIALTVGNNKITIKDVANTAIVYVDNDGEHTINGGKPIILTEKGATLTSAYTEDSVAPSAFGNFKNSVVTIDASAVEQDLTITGNAKANRIIGTDGNDSINGGDGNDKLEGGKGTDSLTGGKGDDIFIYNDGDGKDIIVDYADGDKISIGSGKVSTAIASNGVDFIFNVGSGKITLKDAAVKDIVYIDSKGKETIIPSPVKGVTLPASYEDSTYTASSGSLITIDASAVEHKLTITGNAKANRIIGTAQNDSIYGDDGNDKLFGGEGADKLYGGEGDDSIVGQAGNDSLWGGEGDDTLVGGDGKDVFFFSKGDGVDFIEDYDYKLDKIIVSGKILDYSSDGKNMTFNIGDEGDQLVVAINNNKSIALQDSNGNSKNYPI